MSRLTVLSEIGAERVRQDILWGEQNHDGYRWVAILGEEFGEACLAVNDSRTDLRDELVQVAAVAVSWIECIDRCERDSQGRA